MSFGTLCLVVFVLYPIASLMLLATLCLYTEYNLYRSKQVAQEQLETMLGAECVHAAKLAPSTILDYSGTSPN